MGCICLAARTSIRHHALYSSSVCCITQSGIRFTGCIRAERENHATRIEVFAAGSASPHLTGFTAGRWRGRRYWLLTYAATDRRYWLAGVRIPREKTLCLPEVYLSEITVFSAGRLRAPPEAFLCPVQAVERVQAEISTARRVKAPFHPRKAAAARLPGC